MKFDRTFIAIRERPTLGLYDLALHVVVEHFSSLLGLLILGAAPWIALDLWLLSWMLDPSYGPELRFAFYWAMTALVISQAQVGTWLMVHYLGKAMFEGRARVSDVLKSAWRTPPYFWFSQGLLRLVLVSPAICLLFNGESEATFLACYLLLTPSVLTGALVRMLRPYTSEILMLERTPIAKQENGINFAQRSRSLHAFASSDLMAKAMLSGALGGMLAFALHGFLVTVDSVFNIRANSTQSLQPYYWVASLWIVVGFLGVVRFLSYIDLRIRQEGWAVELRMRAEAQRLQALESVGG